MRKPKVKPAPGSSGGFTLIEVMMAMSLLMVSALFIFHSTRIVRQLNGQFSREVTQIGENELQRLLVQHNHPDSTSNHKGPWKIEARSIVEEGVIHFHVDVHMVRNPSMSYRLYTARLQSDYARIER